MVFGGRLGVGDGICEARSLLAATSADRQQGSGSRDPSEPCTLHISVHPCPARTRVVWFFKNAMAITQVAASNSIRKWQGLNRIEDQACHQPRTSAWI